MKVKDRQVKVESEIGPNMPIALHFHAMASFNESMSMLIGGETYHDSYLSLTWFYDHSSQEFKTGPRLLEGRMLHSAGKSDLQKLYLTHCRYSWFFYSPCKSHFTTLVKKCLRLSKTQDLASSRG